MAPRPGTVRLAPDARGGDSRTLTAGGVPALIPEVDRDAIVAKTHPVVVPTTLAAAPYGRIARRRD